MIDDPSNQPRADRAIFVSYASQDAAVTTTVVEHLESQSIQCWMAPRDVKPGSAYADAIVRAIGEAKAWFCCSRRMPWHQHTSGGKWSGQRRSASS
jgi:hypothetical protein